MPAYKDTNGTYFVSFYYEDFRGVKKRKMKRGFARRRDALDWERRFLLQNTADLNMKFSDFVEIYRNDKQMRIRESTWESKNNMIDLKILPYFKDADMPHKRVAVCFDYNILDSFMAEWMLRKQQLRRREITREEYQEWKLNWPSTADDCGKFKPKKAWRKE